MHRSILLLCDHDDSVLGCEHCAVSGSGEAISIWLLGVFH